MGYQTLNRAANLVPLIACVDVALAQTTLPKDCVPAASATQRQRCDEAAANQVRSSSQVTALEGGWQLARTREPGGQGEAISVMRPVDTSRSDTGLAGMTLRCDGSGGSEVVIVVLEPQPRAAHPRIILTAGANRAEFEASVIQGGQALRLPGAAADLVSALKPDISELSIEISSGSTPIRGVVPLAGLGAARQALKTNCPAR